MLALSGCLVAAAGAWTWAAYQDFIAHSQANLVCLNQHVDNGINLFGDHQKVLEHGAFAAGEYHAPMKIKAELSGLTQPPTWEADQISPPENTLVAGIVVKGKPYAFALDAMNRPSEAVINLTIAEVPISVAYCNLVDYLRVLKRPSGTGPTQLRIGGLDVQNRMVLLLKGIRYAHDSESLPLIDYPFERMTYGEWRQRHPDSRVFLRSPEGNGLQRT
ncbi:MAG: DUF3179 domain-containing (seleno)protein [Rubripirellula sp.]